MTWQLYTAISVTSLSLSVLLQRVLLSKDKIHPIAYVVVFQAFVGIVALGMALVEGFRLPDLSGVWFPALACMVLYGAGHITYAEALQRVEASVFAVLFATHAVWVSALGIVVFHEHMDVLKIIGALLIFTSILLLIKRKSDFRLDAGTWLGLLTGLLFGFAITAWAYVGRHVDSPLAWTAVSFIIPALLVWMVVPRVTSHMRQLFTGGILVRLVVLSVLYAVGCAAMLYAYKYGEFSVVSPLRQAGVVVTVLLALLFLSQERTRIVRKLTAAAVCVAGIICLL